MKTQFISITALALCLMAMPAMVEQGQHKERGQHKGGMMKKADTNGDGYITKDEMLAAHKKRIDKMFEKSDTDGDGKLSKEELGAGRKQMQEQMQERMEERKDKRDERREENQAKRQERQEDRQNAQSDESAE